MLRIAFAVLSESRLSQRKTVILTACFGVLLSAANHTILFLIGPQRYLSITFLSFFLPNALYCFLVSKYRDGRFFLTFFLALGLYTEIVSFTSFLKGVWPAGGYAAMLLLRLFLFPALIWASHRRLREPYRTVQRQVKANWTALAVTGGMFYLALYLMWSVPQVTIIDSPLYLTALVLVMLLMPLVYWVILADLLRQQELYQAQERERLLESEAAALHFRVEQTTLTEQQLDIQRHDLHHRFQTPDAMPERGKTRSTRCGRCRRSSV